MCVGAAAATAASRRDNNTERGESTEQATSHKTHGVSCSGEFEASAAERSRHERVRAEESGS